MRSTGLPGFLSSIQVSLLFLVSGSFDDVKRVSAGTSRPTCFRLVISTWVFSIGLRLVTVRSRGMTHPVHTSQDNPLLVRRFVLVVLCLPFELFKVRHLLAESENAFLERLFDVEYVGTAGEGCSVV